MIGSNLPLQKGISLADYTGERFGFTNGCTGYRLIFVIMARNRSRLLREIGM
jgi:hypothetical protein